MSLPRVTVTFDLTLRVDCEDKPLEHEPWRWRRVHQFWKADGAEANADDDGTKVGTTLGPRYCAATARVPTDHGVAGDSATGARVPPGVPVRSSGAAPGLSAFQPRGDHDACGTFG